MKKITAILALLISIGIYAQNPQINVKGADSSKVKMSQMLINVKIVGNMAYTTAEMHFTNKTNRQMEAELLFPLPEGVSVSRYAIDINGKMRDAVPVEKSKGKQVFEAIEHRRVDPGLLEKVEGNNFKTRIYPIMPNGERIVLIGYEQELSSFDKNNLAYQIVSKYAHKLEKFEVVINVLGTSVKPEIINENNNSTEIALADLKQNFQASIKKSNYRPSEKLLIKIPVQTETTSVAMQSVENQNYFYANTFIENSKIQKKSPNTIGLIWDVSLSCKNRDLKKELELLESYFKKLNSVKVTLYTISYTFNKKQTYSIVNGNWSALKSELENIKYDGGSKFSQIKLPLHDEYLFFSDGMSTLSDNEITSGKPFYTVTSLVSSDYSFLNYNALKSGAELINLNNKNVKDALEQLLFRNLKFLGIKENFSVAEMYPIAGTKVSGNFSVSGISLKDKNEIVLLFGYDDKIVLEKKVSLDLQNQATSDISIQKLWAQKKIANLELQYDKNSAEIEAAGKKYGIVTKNTSLIVLENISDYVMYDIVPPAELRAEFDQIMKRQRENRIAQQKSNWNNIENYFNQLQSWWNKDIKYQQPKPIPQPKIKTPKPQKIRRSAQATVSVNGNVSGVITDDSGLALPGVTVIVRGTSTGVQTDLDGKYSIAAKNGDTLELSYVGFNRQSFRVGQSGTYNAVMQDNNAVLENVVVQGYRSNVKRSPVSAASTIQAASDKESKGFIQEITSVIPGLNIVSGSGAPGSNTSVINRDSLIANRNLERIKVKSWSPERTYLKIMEAAPDDKKYFAYLELREDQENNPGFYFDVANYFYNLGDRQKALLILSNIADLGLENHQLYKSLTYVFRQWEAYEDALFTANQLVKWREHEPQSHRDLALALEDNKQYQAAFDQLIKGLEVNYYGEMSGHYQGVEDVILMDLNRIASEHKNIKTDKLDKKYLKEMPVDVRIILNWNQMDTDIDLHVIEPNGEKCYYGHRNTAAGARFSKDFTQGYGPEQYLLRNQIKGKFVIKTNYFGESALTENGPATVMVEVYTKKQNGKTERKIQTIQLGKISQNENLAEITIF